jgi:hypothetical protein
MADYPERSVMIETLSQFGYKVSSRNSTAQLTKKWDKYAESEAAMESAKETAAETGVPAVAVIHTKEDVAKRKALVKANHKRLRKLRKRRGW